MEKIIELFKYTLSGFWIFCGSYLILAMCLYFIANGFLRIYGRFIRMIIVLFRGWPPSHLDADGDLVNEPKEDIVQ